MNSDIVLEVDDLEITVNELKAVRGISFKVQAGRRIGIVGESGAGKSLTALAIMGLLGDGWHTTGQVTHKGMNLLKLKDREMAPLRGKSLSMIFQDPTSSLNPVRRVGSQIQRVLMTHLDISRAEAEKRALGLLESLSLPRPELLMRAYPHQLSGGQAQRIMIAMAMACYPNLIIADEPTTALDASVQKQVLRFLDGAVRQRQCALLMITHDLPVIAAMCDEVLVMYAGRIVEQGPVKEVFGSPVHPYTAGLIAAQPTMDRVSEGLGKLVSIPGEVPSLDSIVSGCAFRTRCTLASELCAKQPPANTLGERRYECWHPGLEGEL